MRASWHRRGPGGKRGGRRSLGKGNLARAGCPKSDGRRQGHSLPGSALGRGRRFCRAGRHRPRKGLLGAVGVVRAGARPRRREKRPKALGPDGPKAAQGFARRPRFSRPSQRTGNAGGRQRGKAPGPSAGRRAHQSAEPTSDPADRARHPAPRRSRKKPPRIPALSAPKAKGFASQGQGPACRAVRPRPQAPQRAKAPARWRALAAEARPRPGRAASPAGCWRGFACPRRDR